MSAPELTDIALIDLAAERFGGRVLEANDEFFAEKENLLKVEAPIFIEGRYTDRGKWMDGWETRRRRTPGHDWCIVQLGLRGVIRAVDVDTAFFRGNFPEQFSIEAADAEQPWREILPCTPLQGDALQRFAVADSLPVTRIKFHIYPDGGVARLRILGEVAAASPSGEFDVAAIENGGRPIDSSDRFFSHPQNLLMPGPSLNMGDGWETRRRRGPGHDWVVIQLATRARLHRATVDTSHFKGNYPDRCSIDAADDTLQWSQILGQTKLQADTAHQFALIDAGAATHVRLNIYPDGGVARLRIWGSRD